MGLVVGAKISYTFNFESVCDSSSEGIAKAINFESGLNVTLQPNPNTLIFGIDFNGFYE